MELKSLISSNVGHNKRNYIASTACIIVSVFLFINFAILLFHPYLRVIEGGNTLHTLIATCMGLLYFFSSILIYYAVEMEIVKRSKSYGYMMQNGADGKHLKKFISGEYKRIGRISLLLGVVLGLAYSPISLMVVRKVINSERFTMYLPISAILITVIGYLLMLFFISRMVSKIAMGKSPIQIIKKSLTDTDRSRGLILFIIIGIISLVLGASFIYSYYTKSFMYTFLKGDYGAVAIALVSLIAMYFCIYFAFRKFVVWFIKSDYYKRGINMLVFSDIRYNLRRNTNVLFILTIVFTSVFLFTTVLFSLQKEVETRVREVYPFDYYYVHVNYNQIGEQKASFIDTRLYGKRGYKYYYNKLYYDFENPAIGVISLEHYNKITSMLGFKNQHPDLDEAIIVYGSNSKKFDYKKADKAAKELLVRHKMGAYKLRRVLKPISPRGLYEAIIVLNNKTFEDMNKSAMGVKVINQYKVDDWNEDFRTAYTIKDEVTDGDTNNEGFYSAGLEYQEQSIIKNLLFFSCLIMSVFLIVSTELILHFTAKGDLDSDIKKYSTMFRCGVDHHVITKIIFFKNFIIMYIPYIISGIILLISIFAYGNNISEFYDDAVWSILLIFFALYTLLFAITTYSYVRRINKSVR